MGSIVVLFVLLILALGGVFLFLGITGVTKKVGKTAMDMKKEMMEEDEVDNKNNKHTGRDVK